MTSCEWFVVKAVFGSLASVAFFASCAFGYMAYELEEWKLSSLRAWASAKWAIIEQTGLKDLPERCISWAVGLLATADLSFWRSSNKPGTFFGNPAGLFIFGVWLLPVFAFNPYGAVAKWADERALFWVLFLVALIIMVPNFLVDFVERTGATPPSAMLSGAAAFGMAIFFSVSFVGCILQALLYHPSLWASSLVLFVMMTSMWLFIVNSSSFRGLFHYYSAKWNQPSKTFMFILGVFISFSVTLLAMAIGHTASGGDWVPRTIQMLVSNVLFDGLTLVATFWILVHAVGPQRLWSIPIAVLVDLMIAAGCAFASLWLGLLGTDRALAWSQILRVLIGQHPEGGTVHLGPLFWVMHTVFIPTFLYLMLILIIWIAKGALVLVSSHLKRFSEVMNPFGLTAALFMVVLSLFTAMATVAGYFEEAAKAREQKQIIHTAPL